MRLILHTPRLRSWTASSLFAIKQNRFLWERNQSNLLWYYGYCHKIQHAYSGRYPFTNSGAYPFSPLMIFSIEAKLILFWNSLLLTQIFLIHVRFRQDDQRDTSLVNTSRIQNPFFLSKNCNTVSCKNHQWLWCQWPVPVTSENCNTVSCKNWKELQRTWCYWHVPYVIIIGRWKSQKKMNYI